MEDTCPISGSCVDPAQRLLRDKRCSRVMGGRLVGVIDHSSHLTNRKWLRLSLVRLPFACKLANVVHAVCFFHSAPPNSGKTNKLARISMIVPQTTTRPNRWVGGKPERTRMAKPAAMITSE